MGQRFRVPENNWEGDFQNLGHSLCSKTDRTNAESKQVGNDETLTQDTSNLKEYQDGEVEHNSTDLH